jgi:hypothetical protein
MGETRVDLHQLLEDLRDAYPGSIEETILTEIVANSLDSGATRIVLAADPAQSTLAVMDDGSGMQRRELARYHDIAASTKTRGQGIGFAGVGIKLGLLVCDEVVTETRRASAHIATRWGLASRHKAPWKWIEAPGMLNGRGTAVRLKLGNALSPLLDAGFIEATLRRHYEPLLEPAFDPILASHYPHGIGFEVNGRMLERAAANGAIRAPITIRLARKHKPSAIGYMVREDAVLPEERRGMAISTYGKVIKRGWDWLGLTPAAPELVGGTIEAPALAECLTLNKGDFIRTGQRGALYLAYRKAIQEAVSSQLAEWGDSRDLADQARRRAARPMERDLENVLIDLADEFPLLASLVERRAGGQRRLPIGSAAAADARTLVAASLAGAGEGTAGEWEGEPPAATVGLAEPPPQVTEREAGEEPEAAAETHGADLTLPGTAGARRPARYGLSIQFEARPDDAELGHLVESTVWVNEAHPAYRRAAASHSVGYHIALAVAMALAPLAAGPPEEHRFVTTFLDQWGRAVERSPRQRKRAHRR